MKNVAVVGFGFMGMTHAGNILKNNGLKLVAIVDKDINSIESKLTSETGNFSTGDFDPGLIKGINKYEKLGKCLENEKLDAVHICVHTDLHFQLAKQALDAGIHVFLEKPMTLDLEQGQQLIQLANKKGLIFMVGHVLRFMSPYEKLKQWIDNHEYGKLKFLSLSRYSGVPAWGQWKEKQSNFGSSGGALFDLLIHDIDFVNYLFGTPDNIDCKYLPGALSKHDYISSFWTYSDQEFTIKLEGGNTFHSNFPFQAGFMANFEKASIFYTTLTPAIIQVANNDEVKEIGAEDGGDGFYNEIDYFTNCLYSNEKPEKCTPESALETIRICYRHLK